MNREQASKAAVERTWRIDTLRSILNNLYEHTQNSQQQSRTEVYHKAKLPDTMSGLY